MHHTVEVANLHYSYQKGHEVLCGVSLSVGMGEKIALVGPNGAGKSTLMLHLNGVLQGEGDVVVAGQRVCDRTLGAVRAAVGLVFQNPDDQLFSPTVFEDVAFGPLYMGLEESEVRQRVQSALQAVGMEHAVQRVPFHMSEGEKKRVAIATVLAMNPEILVLDEPTAGLDPRARRELIELLRRLPQTMLVATHDMPMVAELFSRTVVMNGGAIVADADTAAILRDVKLLEDHGLEALRASGT